MLSSEAVAAVDGAIVAGLKGDLASLTALGADSVEHGTGGCAGLTLAGIAAALAALGFVGEAFFSIELLLTGSEHEFLSAILADQSLVVVHGIPLFDINVIVRSCKCRTLDLSYPSRWKKSNAFFTENVPTGNFFSSKHYIDTFLPGF